ncbi:MAG: 2-C-methyl-D-erythritol 4-phosphate cytidylyltransferase [Chloroflexota bacterium]
MRRAAIIVAAGRGTRMGEDKVWLPLGGLPVVAHSLKAFATLPSVRRVVLVVSRERVQSGRELVARLGMAALVCQGGERRQDSVKNGLDALGDEELVAIHDGARPLVSPSLIEACFEAAARDGAAIPAVALRDTVKRANPDLWVEETLQRAGLWAVQTPQVFETGLIREAYARLSGEVTDESAAVELLGHRVRIVPGDPRNFKLTTLEDLVVARALVEG